MSHELDEDLSALIDGELPAADAERAQLHAADCPQCRATLDRLRGASAAFKRSGGVAVPPGLLKAPPPATPRLSARPRALQFAAALAVLIGLALATGMATKKFLPGLFGQIQGMISGAAGALGGGEK